MVAKVANDQLAKLVEAGEKKEDLLQKLSDASGAEPPVLAEVLAGNVTPVPEPVLSEEDLVHYDPEKLLKGMKKEITSMKSFPCSRKGNVKKLKAWIQTLTSG